MLAAFLLAAAPLAASDSVPPNPAIDMEAHLRLSAEAARLRETHRVSEEEFLRMSGEPGTVVLDARSEAMYDLRHVRGAVNLSFPDFTADRLAEIIPDKATRILIYCNNNFQNDPKAFALKAPAASLNLSTYATLYMYGYRNVYELGPYLDVRTCRVKLEPAL
jgi:rhodanese-related sulfurtransferase